MIDPNAFKRINPKSSFATKKLTDGLGAEAMDSESPPENDDFLFLLPPNLMGYSMEEKAWYKFGLVAGQLSIKAVYAKMLQAGAGRRAGGGAAGAEARAGRGGGATRGGN